MYIIACLLKSSYVSEVNDAVITHIYIRIVSHNTCTCTTCTDLIGLQK
jgi:hypothetical protein